MAIGIFFAIEVPVSPDTSFGAFFQLSGSSKSFGLVYAWNQIHPPRTPWPTGTQRRQARHLGDWLLNVSNVGVGRYRKYAGSSQTPTYGV